MSIQKKETIQIIIFLLVLLIVAFPYIYLGDASLIRAHDYLDSNMAYLKMFRDYGLFGQFDVATPALDGMSTLYFAVASYSFPSLPFYLFSAYWAHVIVVIFSILFAFASMRIFLNTFLPAYRNSYLLFGTSLVFSILPNFYSWSIGVASLPLIICFFYWISKREASSYHYSVLLLFIYPFFSGFASVGIFILGFWLLGAIYISIKAKKIHRQLFVGFIVLCLGYILADARLFYARFIVQEVLTRGGIIENEFILLDQLQLFWESFLSLLKNGYYHGESLHDRVIFPIVTGTLAVTLVKLVGDKFSVSCINKFYSRYFQNQNSINTFFIVACFLFFSLFIAALGSTSIPDKIFEIILPPLKGLSFARLFLFARFLWYVAFALALCIWVYEFKWILFVRVFSRFFLQQKALFIYAIVIIVLQTVHIVKSDSAAYQMFSRSNYKLALSEIFGVYQDFEVKFHQPEVTSNAIPMRDYYAPKLFDIIKKDINYTNEKVLSFKLDPAITTYNGFYNVGGYNSSYPRSYMMKFRKLIEPEFEVNHQMRDYYDEWGGRLYLYNSESGDNGYTLRINPDVMRNDFYIRYVLSSVFIKNSVSLGLRLHKYYSDPSSVYGVYLYSVEAPK